MLFAHFSELDAERFELRYHANDPLRDDDGDEEDVANTARQATRGGGDVDGLRLDVDAALDSEQLYAPQRVLSTSVGCPSSDGALAESALERFYTFADWIAEL